MPWQVALLGTDFSRASLEVREHLAFTPVECRQIYAEIAPRWPGELLILSTCNRSEFLLACSDPQDAAARLLEELTRRRPRVRAFDDCGYRYSGHHAVGHLMAVAAGLKSKVIGDAQIASQLRHAAALAGQAGLAGPHLREAVHASLRAAKRIRRETGIGTGAASTGAAVLGAIRREFGSTSRLNVLILGAGQAAGDVASHLSRQRFASVTIAARRLEAARQLESAFRAKAVPWSGAEHAIAAADVTIAAVSVPLAFLTRERLAQIRSHSSRRALLVDLGVPRAVDPECAGLAGVRILDVDRIHSELATTMTVREQAARQATHILEEEMARYLHRQNRLTVEPAIRELYRQAELIRLDVVARHGTDSPETARRLMKHLLDGPVRRLRQLATRDRAAAEEAAWVLTAVD